MRTFTLELFLQFMLRRNINEPAIIAFTLSKSRAFQRSAHARSRILALWQSNSTSANKADVGKLHLQHAPISAFERRTTALGRLRWALNRLPTSSCYDCFRDELVSSGATTLGRKPKFKLRHNPLLSKL